MGAVYATVIPCFLKVGHTFNKTEEARFHGSGQGRSFEAFISFYSHSLTILLAIDGMHL